MASLSSFEAEALLEKVQPLAARDVGTKRFQQQQEVWSRVNMQAHLDARNEADEYLPELLANTGKARMRVALHELLVIELFKARAWPALAEQAAGLKSSVKPYFMLYQESLLCNLFEVVSYHRTALDALGDDIVELEDYCYRRMVLLASRDAEDFFEPPASSSGAAKAKSSALAAAESAASVSIARQFREIEFQCCLSSLTIVRALSEFCSVLPPGIMSNLLDKHDVVSVLVQLLERAPWRRAGPSGLEKWSDGKWVPWPEVHKLTKYEAQVWMTLFYLLLAPHCRARYVWTEQRRAVVARLRGFCNEVLLDQIPALGDLFRGVEQLMMASGADMPTAPRPALLLETVSGMRETILKQTDWNEVVRYQRTAVLVDDDAETREHLKQLASVYSGEVLDELLDDPVCANCGRPAAKRCSQCHTEWYCGRECQVAHWKRHKEACRLIVAGK